MPRKGENIYKRKDGRWEGRYIKSRDYANKAIYGYMYGKTYTEVKSKLRKAMQEKVATVRCYSKFEFVANEWLENKRLNIKRSTLAHYKSVMDKHIIPLLGNHSFYAITTKLVQDYINRLLEEGYAAKTVNDILSVLKNILKFAEHKGYQNNCDLGLIKIKIPKKEPEALTAYEQNNLCKYLISNLNFKNFGMLLCLHTGIRIGELCALKWSDFDFKEKTLRIDKTLLRVRNNYDCENEHKTSVIITSPKSETSIRIIPLPNCIMAWISELSINSEGYVLTNSSHKYLEPRNMQYHFKTILKKCGIRNVKFHILRHTFATHCVESNFEIKSLSEILGHSNVKITLDRYVHTSMELKRKNMEMLTFLST